MFNVCDNCGLYRADKVELEIAGVRVTERTDQALWRREIWGRKAGMVFQHADEALDLETTVREAFVGLPGSRSFVHQALGAFRQHAAFPSIGGVAPEFIPGIAWSDHWSYHQMGFPSLMITDTAPFRNPQYHRTTDLPETVDYGSLARVTKGVEAVVGELVK